MQYIIPLNLLTHLKSRVRNNNTPFDRILSKSSALNEVLCHGNFSNLH